MVSASLSPRDHGAGERDDVPIDNSLRFRSCWRYGRAGRDSATAQLKDKEIHLGIGGPLTGSAASFGTEMRNAVELAVAEQHAKGGILGAKLVAVAADDEAKAPKGEAHAEEQTILLLAVVATPTATSTIAASAVYDGCGFPMLTPTASNPTVTDRGLNTVFRLTNRDDRKGPAIAAYLISDMGKRSAVVIDDSTAYGKGLADLFSQGSGGQGRQGAAAPRGQGRRYRVRRSREGSAEGFRRTVLRASARAPTS